ncbi:hypothetical protein ACP4OV_023537 [Aristida adscensionis]
MAGASKIICTYFICTRRSALGMSAQADNMAEPSSGSTVVMYPSIMRRHETQTAFSLPDQNLHHVDRQFGMPPELGGNAFLTTPQGWILVGLLRLLPPRPENDLKDGTWETIKMFDSASADHKPFWIVPVANYSGRRIKISDHVSRSIIWGLLGSNIATTIKVSGSSMT